MINPATKINSLGDIPDLSKVIMFLPVHFFSCEGETLCYQMRFFTREKNYVAEFKTFDELKYFCQSMKKVFDPKKVRGYLNCVPAVELRGD